MNLTIPERYLAPGVIDKNMNKKTIIGITGGLATGKSTIAEIFVGLGAVKIDADAISHRILENDPGIAAEIVSAFGKEVMTCGSIDRRKLASKVFFDKDGLKKLCRIMHPAIIHRINEDAAQVPEGVVVIDAPLLFEVGMTAEVDRIVVVRCDRDSQIERAMRRGISKKEAEAIIGCQMDMDLKERAADYIIDTEKDHKTVKKGVETIWKKM